ncbi:MAG: TraR/DksA C4-type zinc finger protein, partial [Desulfocapsaceae bacterium]|nr:TraR/DksA C4-type zinc finger protein [Desulfocapsaceae bacterium]
LAMRPGIMDVPEEEQKLLEAIRSGAASQDQIKEYEQLHEARSNRLFENGPEAFFSMSELQVAMPQKARIAPSQLCEECREPVMQTKLQEINGRKLCRSCRE